MKSLDQAFIKAYKRAPVAAQPDAAYEFTRPLQAPVANRYADSAPTSPRSGAEAWQDAGLRYRLDTPLPSADPTPQDSRMPLAAQAYADLEPGRPYYAAPTQPDVAISGPHFATTPPVELPEPMPTLAADDTDMLPANAESEISPASAVATQSTAWRLHTAVPDETHEQSSPDRTVEQQPDSFPNYRKTSQEHTTHRLDRQTRDRLQAAAALKLPPPPQLPTIFQGVETPDPVAEEVAEAGFAPDWEVDHFAWPDICERLLVAEATYFQHVGERLLEATVQYPHVLMIAGCRRGDGRTTLALCLARCAAQAGVKVALLDADYKNPQLATRLGIEISCGWSDVLRGKAPLNEAAVASVGDRLTLFPLTDTEPVDLPPGDAVLSSLVREISTHYPLVVVDVGPLGAEDRHPFASDDGCPVNAAIVIRDLRFTTEKKAIATARQLERSGIPAVGIAENFVEREA